MFILDVNWPHGGLLPRVPLEIFQIYPQLVVVAPGQHVDVFVAEPKLLLGGAEAVLVFIPIAIETLSRLAVVAPSLYYLKCKCSCPQCWLSISFSKVLFLEHAFNGNVPADIPYATPHPS